MTELEEKVLKSLYVLWKSLDFSDMSRSRLLGIWDEFTNKIIYSSYARTPGEFLERFAKKFGLTQFADPVLLDVLDEEVLKAIRKEPRKYVLYLRGVIELEKETQKKQLDMAKEKKKLKERMEEDIKRFDEFLKQVREVRG